MKNLMKQKKIFKKNCKNKMDNKKEKFVCGRWRLEAKNKN